MATRVSGKSRYVCRDCGAVAIRWQGQCPGCSAWNTLEEQRADPAAGRFDPLAPPSVLERLSDISVVELPRRPTGMAEFDRVLGGGLVPGSVVLIGGDPGIGKSTLLLQALAAVAGDDDRAGGRSRALYVTGEESLGQVALRAQRLGLEGKSLPVLAEISLERIGATILAERPEVVVIDSIQTLVTEALESAPGSVAQVRDCAAQLTRLAKQHGITVVLIGHVTKEGALAGPRVLEHMVDTVLYFEGDPHSTFRLVRAIKNRFGAANELGVFAMTDRGLRAVDNPSALFLSRHEKPVPGSCVLVTQEGTRPLLVEIQALVDTAQGAAPRRLSVGLDAARLALLLAVLHRHAGVVTHDQDVFVNAVGGVRIGEPAADLAVVLAILTSLRNRPLGRGLAVFGEIGLTGEIRPSPRGQERLREAAKLGFSRVIAPRANAPKRPIEGLEVVAVERIDQAIDAI
ncbi:MAG: DNA repair protein RadA [Burkholderiaceae bacterium]